MTKRKPREEHEKRGRPPFKRTEENIRDVEEMCRLNLTHDQIAAQIGISTPTLEKHFFPELLRTKVKMGRQAVSKLYINVLGGDERAIEFLLSTQFAAEGWGKGLALTGANGKGLFDGLELSRLTDEQFQHLKEILTAGGAAIQDPA